MSTISIELAGLTLVELTADNAHDYYQIVDRNRDHLTQYGDYLEMRQATLESITESLSNPADKNVKFGIWLHDALIGRPDLSPRSTGHFVIGYWLGNEYTGKGYATMACRALIQHGQRELGATDIFAGVTKGNVSSEAPLGRLGFDVVDDRGTYTLFRLNLNHAISRES